MRTRSSCSSLRIEVSAPLSFVGTYPLDEDFWVAPALAEQYPLRYGDVFATPELDQCRDGKARLWRAVMAVHPSCELGAKAAPNGVQVVRVHKLREVSNGQGAEIRAGFRERDGRIELCRVNLVYLAGITQTPGLDEELFADLRACSRVPLDALRGGRVSAMSHDARVAVRRRDTYFRYRWPLSLLAVTQLEADRIRTDSAFVGPRPAWAV